MLCLVTFSYCAALPDKCDAILILLHLRPLCDLGENEQEEIHHVLMTAGENTQQQYRRTDEQIGQIGKIQHKQNVTMLHCRNGDTY